MKYKITFFDDSIQTVNTLHKVFKLLKRSRNITILDRNNPDHIGEMICLAEEYYAKPLPRFCIVTSRGCDSSSFTDDIDEWIENDMMDFFWCEEERPYVEAYLSQNESFLW